MEKKIIMDSVAKGLEDHYGLKIKDSQFAKELTNKLEELAQKDAENRRIERARFILSGVETDEQALSIIQTIEAEEDDVMIDDVNYEFQGDTLEVIPWEVFENYYNCREFLEAIS